MDGIHARSAFETPAHPEGSASVAIGSRKRFIINHPDYDNPHNVLIILQAPDHADGGFQYETARIICGIITNNRWDGYFSHTKRGPEVDIKKTAILPVGEYYFRLPGGSEGTRPA